MTWRERRDWGGIGRGNLGDLYGDDFDLAVVASLLNNLNPDQFLQFTVPIRGLKGYVVGTWLESSKAASHAQGWPGLTLTCPDFRWKGLLGPCNQLLSYGFGGESQFTTEFDQTLGKNNLA